MTSSGRCKNHEFRSSDGDLPFDHRAAKVSKEPKVPFSRAAANGSIEPFWGCFSQYD